MYTQDLQQIANLTFPESIRYEDGFLDITDQRFRETAISRAYAYFLKKDDDSNLKGLFLNALLELIKEKAGEELSFEKLTVSTEVTTKSGKRIDILIDDGEKEPKNCIIIENKVFHWLNNDLDDYWNHAGPEANKMGVVLTIHPMNPQHKHFVNITHSEWVGRLKGNVPHELTPREYVYLTDFIKHMDSLSKSSDMTDNVKFFFEHADKVVKARDIYEEARLYLLKQLEITASKLDWNLWGWTEGYRHIQPKTKEKQAFYAIAYFEDFFGPHPRIRIILELTGRAMAREADVLEAIKDDEAYKKLEKGTGRGTHWLHIASKSYPLTIDDIANLSGFLVEKIKNDFKPVMDKVFETLGLPPKE